MVYGVVSKCYHVILVQSPPEVSVLTVFKCPNVGICVYNGTRQRAGHGGYQWRFWFEA